MDVQYVVLSEVIDQLNRRINLLPEGTRQIRRFVPEEILDLLDDRIVNYQVSDLTFWPSWEAGKIEITDQDFVEAVLGAHAKSDTPVIVISDDCFSTGIAYRVPANPILALLSYAIEDKSVFQSLDHIFYLELKSILIIVHHDRKMVMADVECQASHQ